MVLYVEGNEEKDEQIPELVVNEEVKKEKIEPKQSFTEPPPRYTEASLVKALEEKGIRKTEHIFSNHYYYFRKTLY